MIRSIAGGFQVDDEVKQRWLLHGQLVRLLSSEDLVDVVGGTAKKAAKSGP